MRATVSVAGIYAVDSSIFDNFAVPVNLDKDTVVENILMETAELECLIPEPSALKWAIGRWSARMVGIWSKLWQTTQYTYNPLENYDRTDTETYGRAIHDANVTSGGDTVNQYTAGFDSSDSSASTPANKSVSTLGSTVTTDTTDNSSRTLTSHGNIGVRSSQELILQQREVEQFNIIDYIIQDFKGQFCLLVY